MNHDYLADLGLRFEERLSKTFHRTAYRFGLKGQHLNDFLSDSHDGVIWAEVASPAIRCDRVNCEYNIMDKLMWCNIC